MSEPEQVTQTLGEPGEPCRSCGAALAPDQRYCLNCGERRGGPRVDFRSHMKSKGAAATPERSAAAGPSGGPGDGGAPGAQTPPGDGAKRQRDYAPLAAAGGIAVLGIMLLIGVLIGRGSGPSTSSAPPPQVVTVDAAPSGESEATADAPEGDEGGGQQASGKASGQKKGGKGQDAAAGGSGSTGDAAVASEDTLKNLQEQSPEEYQDSSAKLPDEIATPGAPPPTDGKAAGGGSGGTTIE